MSGNKNSYLLTVRVSGLGHNLTMELEPLSTVADLKQRIEDASGVLSDYQRLLARGSKLDENHKTLEEVGMKDRTKIMLMHNELYAKEKEGYEAIRLIEDELDDLEKNHLLCR